MHQCSRSCVPYTQPRFWVNKVLVYFFVNLRTVIPFIVMHSKLNISNTLFCCFLKKWEAYCDEVVTAIMMEQLGGTPLVPLRAFCKSKTTSLPGLNFFKLTWAMIKSFKCFLKVFINYCLRDKVVLFCNWS